MSSLGPKRQDQYWNEELKTRASRGNLTALINSMLNKNYSNLNYGENQEK